MIETGFIWSEDYLLHEVGQMTYTFENGESMKVQDEFENSRRAVLIKEMLEKTDLLSSMISFSPYYASEEDLLRVHSLDHIRDMKEACQSGIREIGSDVYGCPISEQIARLSAGGAMKAVDICMKESIKQAYSLIRPPGHHASRDMAMGFCIYNNVAVAASYAIEKYNLNRVLILDWDVHHGNGTEDIFYERDDVLFISIHEENNYPENSGQVESNGKARGMGYNVNIPLPPGTGDGGYKLAFERIIAPIVSQFKPEFIMISAGQDCNALDPSGRMLVSREGFRFFGSKMKALANEYAQGRIAVIQEGGYSLPYVPIATLGVIEGLTEVQTGFDDPHGITEGTIDENVYRALDKVIESQKGHWAFPENQIQHGEEVK